MGCLKGIFRFIILILIIAGFFYFNGPAFVKEKYEGYKSPSREVLCREEKDFGNLCAISPQYKIQRSITIGKYRKLLATHTQTGQKISLVDIGDTTTIKQADFYSTKIDLKLYELLDSVKNYSLEVDDIEITERGTILSKGKIVPYVNFKANLKILPIIKIHGTIAAYNTKNADDGIIKKVSKTINKNKEDTTTKIILSARLFNNYRFDVVSDFIKSISFIGIN